MYPWKYPNSRAASGGGGGICLKPVMILFCLVLKVTLSASKVTYIFDTKYILSLVRTFDCLRWSRIWKGILGTRDFTRNVERDSWKRKISEIYWWERNLAATREVWFAKSLPGTGMRAELGKKTVFGIKMMRDCCEKERECRIRSPLPSVWCSLALSHLSTKLQLIKGNFFPYYTCTSMKTVCQKSSLSLRKGNGGKKWTTRTHRLSKGV